MTCRLKGAYTVGKNSIVLNVIGKSVYFYLVDMRLNKHQYKIMRLHSSCCEQIPLVPQCRFLMF